MEGTKIVDNTSYTLRKSEVARCEPALNSVETPKIMGRNPRTTISLKMKEKELSNESEASENSSSDEPKSPQNEATNYEKQRQLRIAQNKARMEAMGLRKTADSLINLVGKRKSKKAVKNGRKDDDYEPNNDDDDLKDDSSDSKCSSEELEEKKRKKKKKKKERANVTSSGSQKVRSRRLRSDKQATLQKQQDNTELMDEDDALKQAIDLSLKDSEETSDLQHARLSDQAVTASRNEKNKKTFKSRVQMTEDDLVINFCQLDEVGKGSISLRDLQRMADAHDFIWTDKELAAMINCFDSDKDGKLSQDDFLLTAPCDNCLCFSYLKMTFAASFSGATCYKYLKILDSFEEG